MAPHHCLRRPEPEEQDATPLKDNGRHPTHGQRPFVQLGSGSRNANSGLLEVTSPLPQLQQLVQHHQHFRKRRIIQLLQGMG